MNENQENRTNQNIEGEEKDEQNQEQETELQVYESFDEMDLKDEVLRGIYSIGFTDPSPIQQVAIKEFITGRDLIAQAQSGTGKTGAFSIATLQKLDASKREVQAIILSPTRELAEQSCNVISKIGEYIDCRPMLAIGGTKVSENISHIRNGAQVAIGTPGRILDLLQRGMLKGNTIHTLVVDEADEMLNDGFQEQMRNIMNYLTDTCQVCLFSATMNDEVIELTNKFMRNPRRILMNRQMVTLDGISQYYVDCGEEIHKFPTMNDLYSRLQMSQTIIFCNKRETVRALQDYLNQNEHSTCIIHSEMSTEERRNVIKKFRDGGHRILIASDVVARGIDIQGIGCTINFDIPYKFENYIHRIGRAGRYGRKGVTINLVTSKTKEELEKLETFWQCKINQLPINFEDVFRQMLG
jgi:translation initiation factor 4A